MGIFANIENAKATEGGNYLHAGVYDLEVIRLSGYASDEKRAIARRYLEPAARRGAGVPEAAVSLSDGAMAALIEDYCRRVGFKGVTGVRGGRFRGYLFCSCPYCALA